MNTKNLVLMALLVGVGAALYVVTPGMVNGMKPDFMLTMMFIGILLFPTMKETFLLSLATGVLSGLFTTFPAGLVPNIIDKAVTGFVFLAILITLKKIGKQFCYIGYLSGCRNNIIWYGIFSSSTFCVQCQCWCNICYAFRRCCITRCSI